MRAVAVEQSGDDKTGAGGKGLEQTPTIAVPDSQQRVAIEGQDVKCPELDSGGARPVLHLTEVRHAVLVERDDFAVENDIVVGQRSRQRQQLRVFRGHVPTVAGVQSQSVIVDLDQEAVAVELTLECVLDRRQPIDRSQGRQHRRNAGQV